MNYDFNTGQNILKESAHKLLGKECTSQFVREMAKDETGFSIKLWDKMAELGWMSLLIPEEYDGSGINFLDLSILLVEMGYYLMPGPFFSTVVQGGLTVLEAGSDNQKADILPDIANGKRKLTLAWIEEEGTYSPQGIKLKAECRDDGYILTGSKLFVQDAQAADTIICAARTSEGDNGLSLFLIDAKKSGIIIQPLNTMSGDKTFELRFENVSVSKNDLLGDLNGAWPILETVLLKSAVAKSAEMTGGAEKVLEMVVDYAKGRKQFGKPIGAFQAIQHHCADMLTYLDTMKYLMYQASWKISENLPYESEAATCKAWSSDSYRKLTALGHQVIGGLGFMEEYDLQLYFKHAKTSELMFGDADFHREIVAQKMEL
ncbi:acyl-CoA/acyl-ACP dehydrogenase [bacterium]|nr:acyl-CoA/acyl-ACP dehydrogenase [bacterium]